MAQDLKCEIAQGGLAVRNKRSGPWLLWALVEIPYIQPYEKNPT